MSYAGKGLIGAVALTLLGGLGAAQLAFGQDRVGRIPSFTSAPNDGINRAAKADRAAHVTTPAVPTHTISVQLHGMAETSVAVRLPLIGGQRDSTPTPLLTRSVAVACEPVVSVLADIAKQLQPGRCVT